MRRTVVTVALVALLTVGFAATPAGARWRLHHMTYGMVTIVTTST